MTDTDHEPDGSPPGEGAASVGVDGITVEKTASIHGGSAVAVYLTLRSDRADRCSIRVADAIPDELDAPTVEFHPNYDPDRWTEVDGMVVYEATLEPDAETLTVYGVAIDDPAQLSLFAAEPAVEVVGAPDGEAHGTTDGRHGSGTTADTNAETAADGVETVAGGGVGDTAASGDVDSSPRTEDVAERANPRAADDAADVTVPSESSRPDEFSFVGTRLARSSDAGERASPDAGATGAPREAPTGQEPPSPTSAGSTIGDLVADVRRRDLTANERAALREALEIEDPADVDALREEVEQLRREVAAGDRQAADVDRIESRLEATTREIEDRFRSLEAAIASLEETVEDGARWRERLRASLADDEP